MIEIEKYKSIIKMIWYYFLTMHLRESDFPNTEKFEKDLKTRKECRDLGNSICSKYDKMIFVQTWSENLAAKKCYEKAGFLEREKIYRYNC